MAAGAGLRGPPYVAPKGDDVDLKTLLDRLPETTDRIASAAVIAKSIVEGRQSRKRDMAGGKFFALLDEESQSDARLDGLAEDLMARRAALEQRAKRAIETKHDRLGAAEQYLDRLEGKVAELEKSNENTNGGPTVEGSAGSPPPSSDATAAGSKSE